MKPGAGGRRASGAISGLRALYGNTEATRPTATRKGWESPNLPRNWRDRLLNPGEYYGHRARTSHVGKLSRANGTGWAQGKCPFHDDHDASLSVQVVLQ